MYIDSMNTKETYKQYLERQIQYKISIGYPEEVAKTEKPSWTEEQFKKYGNKEPKQGYYSEDGSFHTDSWNAEPTPKFLGVQN